MAYQLFVQPIVNWQLGKVHEVTLIHYTGWRSHVPKDDEELFGYKMVLDRLSHFFVKNRSSDRKALIHCKLGFVRTLTTILALSRLMQRVYGTD